MAAAATTSEVMVKTPDGNCDAALVHPEGSGQWPGVILFPDALGLRPVMRGMAQRLAADGYTVLVVNQFYRSARPPILSSTFSFQNKDDLAKLGALRAPLTHEAVTRDGAAFVAYLDTLPAVSKQKKMGVMGYCMGGPMAVRTAAAVPGRVGAGASFHGGGLVTDQPNSPHRLVPNIKARFYFGVAADDDQREPHAKTELQKAFDAVKLPVRIEVYPDTLHGWCITDMPPGPGGVTIYDEPQAERAWHELTNLFKTALG